MYKKLPTLVLSLLLVPAPAAALARTVFIESPTRNIACQLDSAHGALCTVLSRAEQASVSQRGRVRVFPQGSNPPSGGVRKLRYGHSLRVGHVRCTSRVTGMRCVQMKTHHGFVAARSGIRRF